MLRYGLIFLESLNRDILLAHHSAYATLNDPKLKAAHKLSRIENIHHNLTQALVVKIGLMNIQVKLSSFWSDEIEHRGQP